MEDCTFVRQCAPNQQKKLNKEMKHRSLTEPVSPKYSSAQEEISWAHVS